MSDVIEFKQPQDDESPRIVRSKGGTTSRSYCTHLNRLNISEETQLVTCESCKLVMSSYSALLILTRRWDRMKYDVTEWKKMNDQRENASKAENVKRIIKKLQWTELPDIGDEPARTYWQKITEATGSEPYALFRRGRGEGAQYCILSQNGTGWSDADVVIRHAERAKLSIAQPIEPAG